MLGRKQRNEKTEYRDCVVFFFALEEREHNQKSIARHQTPSMGDEIITIEVRESFERVFQRWRSFFFVPDRG